MIDFIRSKSVKKYLDEDAMIDEISAIAYDKAVDVVGCLYFIQKFNIEMALHRQFVILLELIRPDNV